MEANFRGLGFEDGDVAVVTGARVPVGDATARAACFDEPERRQRPFRRPGRLAGRCAEEPAAFHPARAVRQPWRKRRRVRSGNSVRYEGRGVRAVDSSIHRAGEAQLVRPVLLDVHAGARRHYIQRAQGRQESPISTSSDPARSTPSITRRSARCRARTPPRRCRRSNSADKAFSP